jgi:Ankyrin repeats (3 copies)
MLQTRLKSVLLGFVLGLVYIASSARSGNCDYYDHSYYRSRAQSTPIVSLTLDPQEGLNCDLRIAAREGRVGQVLRLIGLGAKVNGVSDTGESALMYAAQACNVHVGKTLLSNGAELNLRDKTGRTALMFASIDSCSPMISIMTHYSGLNIRARDQSGRTALEYARDGASLYEEGPPVDSVRLLEQALRRSGLKTKKMLSSLHSHSRDLEKSASVFEKKS